jgi:hypothetical protein
VLRGVETVKGERLYLSVKNATPCEKARRKPGRQRCRPVTTGLAPTERCGKADSVSVPSSPGRKGVSLTRPG